MLKNILKNAIKILFIRPFFFLRTSKIVRNYLNKDAKAVLHDDGSVLSSAEEKVVQTLKRDGFAITSLEELFPGEGMLEKLAAIVEERRPHSEVDEGKPFLHSLFPESKFLHLSNNFVKISLRNNVLSIIGAYLERAPKFIHYSLKITKPVTEGEEGFRSQNWHRDPEDKKECKMFIYLNDVEVNSGPFIYIRGSHADGKWGNLFPQKPPKGSYPPAEEVERQIPKEDIVPCVGRAGTVIFADTAGLHRGGYAKTNERVMFTAEYASAATLRPLRYSTADDVLGGLPKLARFAVTKENRAIAKIIESITRNALKYGLY